VADVAVVAAEVLFEGVVGLDGEVMTEGDMTVVTLPEVDIVEVIAAAPGDMHLIERFRSYYYCEADPHFVREV